MGNITLRFIMTQKGINVMHAIHEPSVCLLFARACAGERYVRMRARGRARLSMRVRV